MADIIETLVTRLSFDIDKEALKNFDKQLDSVFKGLTAVAAGATAAATAIFLFTKKFAETNDELGEFARRIGVDVEALQELGFAAELNKSSIDSMNSSLSALSRISSEAARGIGGGVEAFGILGVSVTDAKGQIKDTDALLLDIADSLSQLGTQAEKIELMQKLGISEDLLLTLQQGSAALKQQREEARELGFVFSEEAAKAAGDFNDELLRVMKLIQGVSNIIATRFMKQITPFLKRIQEYVKINKQLIQQKIDIFFNKLVTAIKTVFNVVTRVTSGVLSFIDAMGGLKNTIIVVTGLMLALNASTLLMPILITAAGIAILLLLEDIIKFAEGGESAVGELAKKFPLFDSLLRGTLTLLGMIRDGWIAIFTDGGKVIEELGIMIQELRDKFPMLNQAMLSVFRILQMIGRGWIAIFTDGGKVIEELGIMIQELGQDISKFVIDRLNTVISLLNLIPGIDIDKIGGPGKPANISEDPGRGALLGSLSARTNVDTQANFSPVPIVNNRSDTRNVTVSPNIEININGGDPEEVKRVVKDTLNEQYSGAQSNLESQVEF